MKMSVKWIFAVAMLFSAAASAENPPCDNDNCRAGTQAITHATRSEPFYACPNRELANYVFTVLGFVAIGSSLGAPPNISDTTGEPEFKGEEKTMLDNARAAAKVQTFDQAIAACQPGKSGRKVTILNMQPDTGLAWVGELASKKMYWVPLSALNSLSH